MIYKWFEVLFTTDFVTEEEWNNFILYVSKLNGLFIKWNIYIRFEKNKVRYFVRCKNEIPTTLSDLGSFLIKKVDKPKKIKTRNILKLPYFITNKEKTVIDIYDRNESKKKRALLEAKIGIILYKRDNYLSFTHFVFENRFNRIICRKALFNIPHIFLSIDFSKHTRFLHKKDIKKYLNIEKSLNAFETDKKNSILKLDAFPYFQEDYYLNLNNYDFDKHSMVIGGSGTGKSKLLSLLVSNIHSNPDYKMKYKIVVIDPHSSLENEIGGLDNTKVIDFKTKKHSIDLFKSDKNNVVSETENLIDIFKELMAKEYNSKLERVLRHSIYLLIFIEKMNLTTLRNLVADDEFRSKLIRKYKKNLPEPILNFFLKDFNQLKNKSHQEAISPIVSFIDEMTILPVFTGKDNLESIEETIKQNFLSVISLDQSRLGEKLCKTISGLVMTGLFNLMQKSIIEEHIIFIIDEVAVIQNPIIKRFLSESRKYNLSLMLSGQYFNQIEEDIQKAIFSNVVNYYTFRVSREDAIILSKNMLMELAVHDSHFAKVKMLSELANRECIVRVSRFRKSYSSF